MPGAGNLWRVGLPVGLTNRHACLPGRVPPEPRIQAVRLVGKKDAVAVFKFLHGQKAVHRVATMCRVLRVSRSGYYAWRHRPLSHRQRNDLELMERIVGIHQSSRGTYGAPRIMAELRLVHGIRCSRKRVARLMRDAGIAGVHRRNGRGKVRPRVEGSVYPDLVKCSFTATAPEQLWVVDLTQHGIGEGWLSGDGDRRALAASGGVGHGGPCYCGPGAGCPQHGHLEPAAGDGAVHHTAGMRITGATDPETRYQRVRRPCSGRRKSEWNPWSAPSPARPVPARTPRQTAEEPEADRPSWPAPPR